MKKNVISFLLSILFFVYVPQVSAAVTLPKIFTDNMVLQRNKPVEVWGWANKGDKITVLFNGQKLHAKTGKDGKWSVTLQPMTHGGPFEMTVQSKKENIVLKNILIGDVWLCSGQSNMEWIFRNTSDFSTDVTKSSNASIRLFTVQKDMSYTEEKELAGGQWLECNPQTVPDFSAVGYYFGRKLQQDLDVPIGLINSSWGGTVIQTWMSMDVITQFDRYKNLPRPQIIPRDTIEARNKRYQDAVANDIGMTGKWYDPATATAGWNEVKVPGAWERTAIGNEDGLIWFRKEVNIPAEMAGKEALINLGPIDDRDITYVNGIKAGANDLYSAPRQYRLAKGFKAGKNVIVVRVYDTGGNGGFYGKPEELYVEVDGKKISLAGDWSYRPSALTSTHQVVSMNPNMFPSLLYDAMINPIIDFAIKGAIWYQGESNAGEAHFYRTLFPAMIKNWREKWGYDFPFFWVQLANFMSPDQNPAGSDWAELREAQNRTLSLPATGQAVIIDIGEEKDIHPKNKKEVGERLALSALKVAYGKDIVYSGPVFQSMEIKGNMAILHFTNTGSGMIAKDKYGYLKGFAIAGKDQKFYWAKAGISGNDLVVFGGDEVLEPVAVRYAWGNNPDDANLYNKEGLPASPFRTDNWKGVTE